MAFRRKFKARKKRKYKKTKRLRGYGSSRGGVRL